MCITTHETRSYMHEFMYTASIAEFRQQTVYNTKFVLFQIRVFYFPKRVISFWLFKDLVNSSLDNFSLLKYHYTFLIEVSLHCSSFLNQHDPSQI